MTTFSSKNDPEIQKILSEFEDMPLLRTTERWNRDLLSKIDKPRMKQRTGNNYTLVMGILLIIFLNAGMVAKMIHGSQPVHSNRQQQLEMIASSLMIPSNS